MSTRLLFTTFKTHHFSSSSSPILKKHSTNLKAFTYPSIKMSSFSSHKQIIEHLVLFKVKPGTETSAVDSMMTNLNGLKTLDQVLHISAGAIARTRSSPIQFTHLLHSRYSSVEALEAYSAHPRHVSVVGEFVKPICEDIMAVDWVCDSAGSAEIRPGSGVRVNLVKLKEGLGESEKNEILGVIGGIKEKFEGIEQISFGVNFSPVRAKGFSIGSVAVVPGLGDLEKFDSEGANAEKEKVRGFIESVIVLDYSVPQLQNASL